MQKSQDMSVAGSTYPQSLPPSYSQAVSNRGYTAPSGDKYGSATQVYGSNQYIAQYTSPHGQPGNQPYAAQQQTVVVPAANTHTVIVQQPVYRPQNYMWLSCLVYFCCCPVMGIIGFGLSMASSSAADENRMEEARKYSKGSLWTNIAGIILGIIGGIVIGVLWRSSGYYGYYG